VAYPRWFEGGQMPIQRRLPKRGFDQPRTRSSTSVKLGRLTGAPRARPSMRRGSRAPGIIRKGGPSSCSRAGRAHGLPLTIKVDAASEAARKAVEAAGARSKRRPRRGR